MLRHEVDGLVYYQFETLSGLHGVTHGVFSRLGGVSNPPFAGLNLGRSVGDAPDSVDENYARICRVLQRDRNGLVTGYQVHSNRVAAVGAADAGALLWETDGLVTDSPEITLTLRFADCVPLLLVDPVRRVVGIAHAGWKGTLGRIGARAVEVMQQTFRCEPRDILAGIGPSIGPCCYEIQDDVAHKVREAFGSTDGLIEERQAAGLYLDLWAANRRVLLDAGLHKVETSHICTSCHRDEFFSHRAEGGRTGRFGAFIALSYGDGGES